MTARHDWRQAPPQEEGEAGLHAPQRQPGTPQPRLTKIKPRTGKTRKRASPAPGRCPSRTYPPVSLTRSSPPEAQRTRGAAGARAARRGREPHSCCRRRRRRGLQTPKLHPPPRPVPSPLPGAAERAARPRHHPDTGRGAGAAARRGLPSRLPAALPGTPTGGRQPKGKGGKLPPRLEPSEPLGQEVGPEKTDRGEESKTAGITPAGGGWNRTAPLRSEGRSAGIAAGEGAGLPGAPAGRNARQAVPVRARARHQQAATPDKQSLWELGREDGEDCLCTESQAFLCCFVGNQQRKDVSLQTTAPLP